MRYVTVLQNVSSIEASTHNNRMDSDLSPFIVLRMKRGKKNSPLKDFSFEDSKEKVQKAAPQLGIDRLFLNTCISFSMNQSVYIQGTAF